MSENLRGEPARAIVPKVEEGRDGTDARASSIREIFSLLGDLIRDRSWYDFGCGFGLSTQLLYEFGAREAFGFEPDVTRVRKCPTWMRVSDKDDVAAFDNVIACGVFEHIHLEDRQKTLLSLWKRLRPNGHLVIIDTPNSLLPYDPHTTGMWLVPWLPERVGKFLAERRVKVKPPWWGDWRSCGWRGLWLRDFSCLCGRVNVSPVSRPRHSHLAALGLHPHLIDPWPVWAWRKEA